jgi:hypothetical protein
MEERFLGTGAVAPARRRRRPPLNPRRWPWWARPPALFAAAAALSAGAGVLVAAWQGYDPSASAAWGLYGGGGVLLLVGVAPFLGEPGSGTLESYAQETWALQHSRLAGAATALAYLLFGAGLVALGLLVELYV